MFEPVWVSLCYLCILGNHLCVVLQMVRLFGLLSNESWLRCSLWCLECVVHLYLRCFLGGCCVFLCWAVGYVSLTCISLIGSGSVDVRIYCPGRVCHGVECSG